MPNSRISPPHGCSRANHTSSAPASASTVNGLFTNVSKFAVLERCTVNPPVPSATADRNRPRLPRSAAGRRRSTRAKPMPTARAAMVAHASRVMVSQPPALIAAATLSPAVSAMAPTGSAPRYGLPTTTTARPPTATITAGRQRRCTRWANHPPVTSALARNTPSPTVLSPAYRPPCNAE
ncbi:hypothetical protein B0E54_06343 [Micromonospora sp. MH99]|nr:hypothetical protein [Micromonospora sp. MH99]